MTSETKNCQNCKQDFIIEVEDFSFYQKIKVPPPTFCPECRSARRLLWRNERSLYKRDCDLCHKSFISLYPKDSKYTIFCKECWYGDGWNPLDFGLDYNDQENFFEQFKKLQQKVPRLGIWIVQCTNSPFTNLSYNNKNCYFSFGFRDSEDCAYVSRSVSLKKCIDASYTHYSENLYEASNVEKSYNSFYIQESEALVDSNFIANSRNLSNCFLATNQRGGSYIFMNTPLSKEEYFEKVKSIDLGSRKTRDHYQNIFNDLKSKSIQKYANLLNCQKSTGDHIINAKNANMVFDGFELENAKYSTWVFSSKEIYDCYGMGGSQFVYEAVSPEEVSNTKFVYVVDTSNDVEYSEMCKGSSLLFGCISLQKKNFCILNKQYTKEEYLSLKEKIMKDMVNNPYVGSKGRSFTYGEFFPYDLSPFAYNESSAQEFFPLDKTQAMNYGFRWKEKENRDFVVEIKAEDVPDNIKDVDNTLLNKVINCTHLGKCFHQCTEAFKITEQEFQFYKQNNIPVPVLCPNCRNYERLAKRNPMKLWHRKCMKEGCTNEFETSYAPDRKEIVYCEECYNKEVY